MVDRVIDRRLQHAHTIPHAQFGILEYHGSLRRRHQCDPIDHVAWRVVTRHERCDSHRRKHSTIVGLARTTSCKLHPSAIFQHRHLEVRHDADTEFLSASYAR